MATTPTMSPGALTGTPGTPRSRKHFGLWHMYMYVYMCVCKNTHRDRAYLAHTYAHVYTYGVSERVLVRAPVRVPLCLQYTSTRVILLMMTVILIVTCA